MGHKVWVRGLVIGIFALQIVSMNMIPLSAGLRNNNLLLGHHSNFSSSQQNPNMGMASVAAKSSFSNGEKKVGYTIEVEGWGHGVFFPPRKTYGFVLPEKTRENFFCFVGVITLSGIFNDGYVIVNDNTYHQPLLILFTGPTLVSYHEYSFPSRDRISSLGFSLHKPLILSFN